MRKGGIEMKNPRQILPELDEDIFDGSIASWAMFVFVLIICISMALSHTVYWWSVGKWIDNKRRFSRRFLKRGLKKRPRMVLRNVEAPFIFKEVAKRIKISYSGNTYTKAMKESSLLSQEKNCVLNKCLDAQ